MTAPNKLVIPSGRGGKAAYPRPFAVVPLFALAARGRALELATHVEVEVPAGIDSSVQVFRSGLGMTAEHQDVLLAIFRKFAGLEAPFDAEVNGTERLYVHVQFSAKELLEILGKGYCEDNRTWLRERLVEISRVHIRVLATGEKKSAWPLFSGFILQLRTKAGPRRGVRCSVSIPIEFAQLFERQGYGHINLEQRRGLRSSQLAKLLQVEIECLKDRRTGAHYSFLVETWMTLTGSRATLPNFTKALRDALKRLQSVGALEDFSITKGKVNLTLPGAKPSSSGGDATKVAGRLKTKTEHGEIFILGAEIPDFDEFIEELDSNDPFMLELYGDSQIRGMLALYPKAYKNRKELPRAISVLTKLLDSRSIWAV